MYSITSLMLIQFTPSTLIPLLRLYLAQFLTKFLYRMYWFLFLVISTSNECEFTNKLKEMIWKEDWTDPDDEEQEILHYDIIPLHEADIDSKDNGLLVIAPDRTAFQITIKQVM